MPKHFLAAVEAAATAAGAAIAEIFNQSQEARIWHKADDSPVTAADLAAHTSITSALCKLDPEIPIISEEAALPAFEQRRLWRRYWLVDPLDGTQEFIDGGVEFTVNIALIDEGVPVLGVVYAPMLDLMYSAVAGEGAWKRHGLNRRSIRTRGLSQRLANDLPVELVCSRRHGVEAMGPLAASLELSLGLVVTKSVGSSLKFCLVAEGEADLYPRLAPCCEWDTAAAQAIVEAAGGRIVDIRWQRLTYNKSESVLNDHFYVLGDPTFAWKAQLTDV